MLRCFWQCGVVGILAPATGDSENCKFRLLTHVYLSLAFHSEPAAHSYTIPVRMPAAIQRCSTIAATSYQLPVESIGGSGQALRGLAEVDFTTSERNAGLPPSRRNGIQSRRPRVHALSRTPLPRHPTLKAG